MKRNEGEGGLSSSPCWGRAKDRPHWNVPKKSLLHVMKPSEDTSVYPNEVPS